MTRTPSEVGAIMRRRREAVGRAQDAILGVSAATVRKIEQGTETSPRRRTTSLYATTLGWPADAYERLMAGEDPDGFPTRPTPEAQSTQDQLFLLQDSVEELSQLVRAVLRDLVRDRRLDADEQMQRDRPATGAETPDGEAPPQAL